MMICPPPKTCPTERSKGVLTIGELVEELRGENAKDICVIKVPLSMKYVDFLVIVSGSSTRHLKSMAQYIIRLHKDRKGAKDKFVTVEGEDCEDWMAIDLGNIALHLMLPETRENYELEKLWTLGSEYDDQTRAISFLDFPFTLSDQFGVLKTEE
ncbi:PREDICTED: mitochondrial assembly of ribosomal large subunit protein 1-like [Branchiostoma belcheri]|uniref:Mitochondrial assembly of ribosomal large subunit protein 1 n=1 Tax=Branchiostoma belcheri TaxID=7741 RepID=A0A6P5A2L0_BRABE|nr:PREDICTED: mitochondrial assembly of ribosomal large subunit protein 1-like [Branchiostoma belcheri]